MAKGVLREKKGLFLFVLNVKCLKIYMYVCMNVSMYIIYIPFHLLYFIGGMVYL